MKSIELNQNWNYRKTAEKDFHEITLPFDAGFRERRSPDSVSGSKKGYFENGSYEFYTLFDRPEGEKRIYLELEAVYQNAFVYLNGDFVAFHPYGYTDFVLDITDYLEEKNNYLKVLCSTGDDSRWYAGAGILRPVRLWVGNPCGHFLVRGCKVTTKKEDEKKAEIEFALSVKKDCDVSYLLSLFDKNGTLVHQSLHQDESFTIELDSPLLWDDETPNLYTYRVEMKHQNEVLDSLEEEFGIRMIEVNSHQGLRINGKEKILFGTCIHGDNGVIGCYSDYETEFRKIKALKEAGFNAVRTSHHPANMDLLKACDHLGVYVFEETFDCWHMGKSTSDYAVYFDAYHQDDLRSMVDVSYNHPSVILYSIGNEVADLFSKRGAETERKLVEELRNLDSTRLISNAINGVMLFIQAIEVYGRKFNQDLMNGGGDVNDAMNSMRERMKAFHVGKQMDQMLSLPCSYLDVSGYNYMPERYPHDEKENPLRVIVGTESYAMEMKEIYDYIFSHKNVIGDFCWIGLDYLGEAGIGKITYDGKDQSRGVYSEYPYLTAGCADLDITLERLPQSYLREMVFHKRTKPYIVVENPNHIGETPCKTLWSFEDVLPCWNYPGKEGKMMTVKVYSPSESVTLYLNGSFVGREKTIQDVATFSVKYQSGELKAVNQDGEESILSSYGKERHLRIQENGEKTRFIDAYYVDEQDQVVRNEDVELKLTYQKGELLGFGNGAMKTEEGFHQEIHSTYHGHALAVFRVEEGFEFNLEIVNQKG